MNTMRFSVPRLLAVLATLLAASVANAQRVEPTEIVVRWNTSISLAAKSADAVNALQEAERRHGVKATAQQRLATGSELISLSRRLSDTERDDFLATLRRSASVKHAMENELLSEAFTPNDSRFDEQWHYGQAAGGIRAPSVWDTFSGAGVVVAVVDSGTTNHRDLEPNVIGGYDMVSNLHRANDGDNTRDSDFHDPGNYSEVGDACGERRSSWHGTHLAGTIAAVTNNQLGVAGIAFSARLVSVRVTGRCGAGAFADVVDGIAWAAGIPVPGVPNNPNPARVINISLGFANPCPADMQDVIDAAVSRGAVIVVAAGNDGVDVSTVYPANCRGVIAVAAVNRAGGRASSSNFGAKIALAAPGGEGAAADKILSTSNGGFTRPLVDTYSFESGTSMAAPHVAAVAALIIGKTPSLTPAQVEERLRSSTRSFPQPCAQCGWGIVDAGLAVKDLNLAPPAPTGFTVTTPTSGGEYSIAWRPSNTATRYWTQRKLGSGSWRDELRTTSPLRVFPSSARGLYQHRFKACSDTTGCRNWTIGPTVEVCGGVCQ